MRDDHAHGFPVDFEIGIDSAAGFSTWITEVQFVDRQNFAAREQYIPVMSVSSFQRGSRDRLESSDGG